MYIQSKTRTAFRSKNNVSKVKSVFAIGLAEESNGDQIKGDIWSVKGVAGKSKSVVHVGKQRLPSYIRLIHDTHVALAASPPRQAQLVRFYSTRTPPCRQFSLVLLLILLEIGYTLRSFYCKT